MAEPTCRTCYALTLSDADYERFNAEPTTGPVYYCEEHDLHLERYVDWDTVHVAPHSADDFWTLPHA